MGREDHLKYEHFVRSAFSFALGNNIERGEDPAELADADKFETSTLHRVKAGTTYSMEIFNIHIRDKNKLTDAEYELMDQLVIDVLSAETTEEITSSIDQHKESFVKKYINRKLV
ncbi:hypothetical protein [Paenibacillus aquistagni]|uniref:hypothetical protein n=1 Tax=Paenibacillus aquistagni TaxID=1852522 RepID=UPI00145A988F|nr:hypothetical protein [Paenibacillus aquistagni]NMM52137.1 hypothetical protein [Paenibacillus aquistagni]